MRRQSESIASLAAALAKAQIELENPEKSLIGSIEGKERNAPERLFRYASLASGLEIVRKTLGQHDIATVQTTAIDQAAGIVNLTTVLAHASGEWISSDWPVCPTSETATPHRMGAALTYARRYALFTLVGIAGEDDLDAPDIVVPNAQKPDDRSGSGNGAGQGPLHSHPRKEPVHSRSQRNGKSPAVPAQISILEPQASAQLRDRLIDDIGNLASGDEAALWAHRSLSEKNKLQADDADRVEERFRSQLVIFAAAPAQHTVLPGAETRPESSKKRSPKKTQSQSGIDKSMLALPETRRVRDREHLRHVANQSCLVCGRRPCDAHHLRFAQGRALGRKVSDEFTVPLCRGHHRELHHHGDEAAWWQKVAIDPLTAARALWLETHPQLAPVTTAASARAKARAGKRTPRESRRKPAELRNEANLSR